jgi:hypothetical protein
MLKKAIVSFILVFIFTAETAGQEKDFPAINVPNSSDRDIPPGWVLAGSNPHDYAVGTDLLESVSGQSSAYLKSISTKPVGFVNLMQEIKSNNFKGQRVRLSASIKVKFVSGWTALWMRVEDNVGRPLAFDDMSNRPIIGTSEWIKYEVVLDIPNNSDKISFGLLLSGRGQVWIDNVKLLVVSNDVPVTDLLPKKTDPFYPQNMDFEE